MKAKLHYVIVLVLCAISFGLLIASTSADWYYQSVEQINSSTSAKNCSGSACTKYLKVKTSYFYIEQSIWTSNQTFFNTTEINVHNYTTTKSWAGLPKAFNVLDSSRKLAISAIVFSGIQAVFSLFVIYHFGLKPLRRSFKYAVTIANLLAFILSLASISHFSQFSPAYIQDMHDVGKKCTDLICSGFYGYKTSTSGKTTTNDDWGWSTAWSEVFSATFFLVFSLCMFVVKLWKKKREHFRGDEDL